MSSRVLHLIPWVLKDGSPDQGPRGSLEKDMEKVHSGLRGLHPQQVPVCCLLRLQDNRWGMGHVCSVSPVYNRWGMEQERGEGPCFHSGGSTTNH